MDHRQLKIEAIETFSDFCALESEWRQLLDQIPGHTVFQTHEWMRVWWQTVRNNERMLVVIVRDSGKLVGLAPMMLAGRKHLRLTVRDIRFISTLKPARSPLSFSGSEDFIILPGRESVLPPMLEKLVETAGQWTYLFLQPVPVNSPLLEPLSRFAGNNKFRQYRRVILQNAFRRIEGTFEEYIQSLSRNMRKNIRRALRQFEEYANGNIKVFVSPEEVKTAIEHILQIEQGSWKWKQGIRIDAAENREFYFSIMRDFAPRNWLRVYVLYIGEKPVAYDLNVVYKNTVKTLKGSYREDSARLSPGTVLTYHEIKDFFRQGYGSFDLLWGNLDYKQKWTGQPVPHFRIEITNRTPSAGLISWLEHSGFALRLQNYWNRISR